MEFVHLNLHTEYSLLESNLRIKELCQTIKDDGMIAAAITDNGAMYGALPFYQEMKKKGLQPIIGVSLPYFANENQAQTKASKLILLAENNKGLINLNHLASIASIKNEKYSCIFNEDLKKHNEGLICLLGGNESPLASLFLKADFQAAKQLTEFLITLFGSQNLYIALEKNSLISSEMIFENSLMLAKQLKLPYVAIHPCYYAKKEDEAAIFLLRKLKDNTRTNIDEFLELYPSSEMSANKRRRDEAFKTKEEMFNLFAGYEEALENTVKIAKRCQAAFEEGALHLPAIDTGEADNKTYLYNQAFEGLYKLRDENRLSQDLQNYEKRLRHELEVITGMGYTDYYLIVADFIAYAKSKKIAVGPGRGSGAGSLVAYALGITGIDPLQYDLLFERFLNPDRVSMPDFDIDFCFERRHEVIDYVIAKYGKEHVSQVITFGTLGAKAVVRDIGRVLDLPLSLINQVAKLIPKTLDINLKRPLKKVRPSPPWLIMIIGLKFSLTFV